MKYTRGEVRICVMKNGDVGLTVPALLLSHMAIHRPIEELNPLKLDDFRWVVTYRTVGLSAVDYIWRLRDAKALAESLEALLEKHGEPANWAFNQTTGLGDMSAAMRADYYVIMDEWRAAQRKQLLMKRRVRKGTVATSGDV